jgi:hypothetical protein
MVDPEWMCRQHLTGEHLECHMFVGTIEIKGTIGGFIRNGLLEPVSLQSRHDRLVVEMKRRGYKHTTPLVMPNLDWMARTYRNAVIDVDRSMFALLDRCVRCRHRLEKSDA